MSDVTLPSKTDVELLALARAAATGWDTLSRNHDPQFLQALRKAFAAGFQHGWRQLERSAHETTPVPADIAESFAVWRRFGLTDDWLIRQIVRLRPAQETPATASGCERHDWVGDNACPYCEIAELKADLVHKDDYYSQFDLVPKGASEETAEHPALAAGDLLAHQAVYSQFHERWWQARGGHGKCTVCAPELQPKPLSTLEQYNADMDRWRAGVLPERPNEPK